MTSDARLVAAFAPDGALNITENAAALVQLRHTTSSLIETIAHDFIAICKRINRCNSVCFPGAIGPQRVADTGEAFELTWKFALKHSHRQMCKAGQLPFTGCIRRESHSTDVGLIFALAAILKNAFRVRNDDLRQRPP